MNNNLKRTFGAAALFILCAIVIPASLYAHARLLRSSPSANAKVKVSPARVQLVFSEAPMIAVTRIVILSATNDTLRIGDVHADSTVRHGVIAQFMTTLDSGTYRVNWSTAATDGHPSKGSFSFVVETAKRDAAKAVVRTEPKPRENGASLLKKWRAKRLADAVQFALGAPMWVSRLVAFVALFVLIGAAAFRYLVIIRLPIDTPAEEVFRDIAGLTAAAYGMFSAIAFAITSAIKLYGEAAAMNVSASTILFDTAWGEAWIVQIVASLIAVIAFAAAHRGNRAAWLAAALSAVVLAATPAFTGHAISSDDATYAVPVDTAHVLSASVWLGVLALILFAGIPAAVKTPEGESVGTRIARLVNAFSPVALVCGAVVVATGVTTSLLHIHRLSRLWTTTYGMTLIVKLALVSLLFSLGAWNWRRVKPNLGGDAGVRALRFSARLELAASLLVLAVTAFLVALPLPD